MPDRREKGADMAGGLAGGLAGGAAADKASDVPARLPETDILIEDQGWEALRLEDLAPRAFAAALAELGLDPGRFAVSLLAGSDARIRALNADFRGKDAPTNVLSWPSEERASPVAGQAPALPAVPEDGPPLELGDIAIARETCLREAEAAGIAPRDHLAHLLIHALLHLLGFDHECDADATLMEGIEARTLARLGIANPYEPARPETGEKRQQGPG